MSTFFHFACTKCREQGGMLSRQAWGYGNFNIIESFKFLAFHIDHCGHENICMITEQDDEYREPLGESIESTESYLVAVRHYFPRSYEWELVSVAAQHDWDKANAEWERRELEDQ